MKRVAIALFTSCFLLTSIFASEKIPLYSQFFVKTIQDKGIGYSDGYTTLGSFTSIKPFESYPYQHFFDFRYHHFDSRRWGSSLGTGVRFFNQSIDKVMGVNFFYDCLNSDEFEHQLGAGFEVFGKYLDLRGNGYFPVGNKRLVESSELTIYPGGYFCDAHGRFKALRGGDFEVLSSLKRFYEAPFDLYVGLGSYFYQQNGYRGFWGGKLRCGIQLTKYLKIEFRASYDPIFKKNFQGLAYLAIPLYMLNTKTYNPIYDQLVERQDVISNYPRECKYKVNF